MLKFGSVKYKAIMKAVALALVFVFALSSLCACSSSTDEKKVVGKVGDLEVCYDELYFLASSYKIGLEAKYGEYSSLGEADAKKFTDELRELVYTNIVTNYAILSLCAKEDLSIENKDLDDRVDDYINKMIESEFDSKSEYKANMKEYGLTDRYVRFTAAVDLLYSDLLAELLEDGKIEDDNDKITDLIKNEFVRTWHIMISNDAGEDVEANRAKAEEALAKLRDGSMSMYKLIGSAYNEDFSIGELDGLYFTRGSKTEEYEAAAYALEVGEVSEVIEAPATNANGESVTGFYIIQRLELEDTYITNNLPTLKEQYHDSVMYSMVEAEREALEFVPNDFGKSLDLAALEAPISIAATVRVIVIIAICVVLAGAATAVVVVIVKKKKNKKALAVKK